MNTCCWCFEDIRIKLSPKWSVFSDFLIRRLRLEALCESAVSVCWGFSACETKVGGAVKEQLLLQTYVWLR